MLKPFTKDYEDNSSEAGFQFTFYCDLCHHAYRTTFIESVIFKKKKVLFSAVFQVVQEPSVI